MQLKMQNGDVMKLVAHASLRNSCLRAWGFESLHPYQNADVPESVYGLASETNNLRVRVPSSAQIRLALNGRG
jgi:hypothetical protein